MRSFVYLALILGYGAWCVCGLARGRVPLPANEPTRWACSLAALALLAAVLSPRGGAATSAWAAMAVGLCLFPAATLLSEDERRRVEAFVRFAGWVLVLVAAHQRFNGLQRPLSTYSSPDGFAGAILLLIPFAARGGDFALTAGLVLCLWWSHSVGAWMGLSIALLTHRRSVGSFAFWAGAVAGFTTLVIAYSRLGSPEVTQRGEWWSAAWRMAPYAHHYFLQTAAECGWPYLALWIVGLALLMRRAEPARRFGPVAALVQGLWDFPLGLPGVFWLFCLSAAWTLPESERVVAVPSRFKIPATAAVVALVVLAATQVGVWAAK